MNVLSTDLPNYGAIKARQQSAWSSGDYAVVGTTVQIVGELLCEAVDLRSTQRVLDVAAGNGNATLAAARRFADVTSTDYVGALLEDGKLRARAERANVTFREADAESLPFADDSFDVVLSTFGAMFAPNQVQAAREMLRVCRPGGKIGLASWMPDSLIGRLFKILGQYAPPQPGVKSPTTWGDPAELARLFGPTAQVGGQARTFAFRYRSPAHWLDVFRTFYGPLLRTFAALEPANKDALAQDILALLADVNIAKDGTLVAPSAYFEAVIVKRR